MRDSYVHEGARRGNRKTSLTGKTTCIKLMTSILTPDQGDIKILGHGNYNLLNIMDKIWET